MCCFSFIALSYFTVYPTLLNTRFLITTISYYRGERYIYIYIYIERDTYICVTYAILKTVHTDAYKIDADCFVVELYHNMYILRLQLPYPSILPDAYHCLHRGLQTSERKTNQTPTRGKLCNLMNSYKSIYCFVVLIITRQHEVVSTRYEGRAPGALFKPTLDSHNICQAVTFD